VLTEVPEEGVTGAGGGTEAGGGCGGVLEPLVDGVLEPLLGPVLEPLVDPVLEPFVDPVDPVLEPLVDVVVVVVVVVLPVMAYPETTRSTRRLSCLPSAVELLATGAVCPKPCAVTMSRLTP